MRQTVPEIFRNGHSQQVEEAVEKSLSPGQRVRMDRDTTQKKIRIWPF
jgi:hypothetical protein